MRRAMRAARHVMLPGVGAAADAMAAPAGTADWSRSSRRSTQPVLGICLGMQLLFDGQRRGRRATCLGIIAGIASAASPTGRACPCRTWAGTSCEFDPGAALLAGIERGDYVYFVHSYCAPVGRWTVATTEYGGRFSAVVRHGNFRGVQFHPERSGRVGARLLANFLELG